MDELSFSLFGEIKKKTIFSVNDFQVIFNTDLKTALKLESDDTLRDYISAIVHENLLKSSGIRSTDEITSIQRLQDVDENKSYIVFDIATSLNQGIEELHCLITEERICQEEPCILCEDVLSWNQQVSDVPPGSSMRWNSDLTHLLIEIRGQMDSEFEKSKYKFRLWEKVASCMNSQLTNIKVTAKDCDDKWRNIVATYRKNVDKLKCSGDKVRWEYFDAMDDVLKGTKYLNSTNCEDEINVDAYSTMEEVEIENDNLSQNFIVSKTFLGDERMWTTEQCLSLLCWRHQAEDKFIGSFDNQKRCWEELAVRLNEKFLADFSADEVSFVWNRCNLLYELNLECLKSKGVDAVQWKYFAVMDEIRGGTKEISEICIPKPGNHLLTEFNSIRLQYAYSLADDMLCDTNSISFLADSSNSPVESSDSEDHTLSVSSGILWTRDLVRSLISAKKSVDQDVRSSKVPRKKLWWSVARKFRAQRHVKITEEACEEKWLELVEIYRKNLVKAKKDGVTTVRWPFFWKMYETINSSNPEFILPAVKKNPSFCNESKSEPKSNPSHSVGRISSGVNDDSLFEKSSIDNSNLAAAIHELQENQNKLLREIVDNQQKRIDQLHQEQLSIKSLLVQLLEKLS